MTQRFPDIGNREKVSSDSYDSRCYYQKQIPHNEIHSSEGTSGCQGFDVVTQFFEKTHASWFYQ
jgi:hypothetical protein